MRKLVFLLLAISSPAFAADLPAEKGPPDYAPPSLAFSWTGLYIGGQAGILWGQVGWNRYDPTNTTVIATEFPYATNGFVGAVISVTIIKRANSFSASRAMSMERTIMVTAFQMATRGRTPRAPILRRPFAPEWVSPGIDF